MNSNMFAIDIRAPLDTRFVTRHQTPSKCHAISIANIYNAEHPVWKVRVTPPSDRVI